jgi:hypothetical protein
MVTSRCVKTAGIAIVIGKFISACTLEKRFEAPEGARITTDLRGSPAQNPVLGPPSSPEGTRVASRAAAINEPATPVAATEVNPTASMDAD